MPKKSVKKKTAKKVSQSRPRQVSKKSKKDDSVLFAFLATFLGIVGFLIAFFVRRDDDYVMHYAKISLVIFIVMVIAAVAQTIFLIIPFIGWLINFVLWVLILVLWLMSWIYALSGKKKEIPGVSDFADKFKF